MKDAGAASAEGGSVAFLNGGGEMAGLIAAFDWGKTSVGPLADWPDTMKAVVSLIIRSPVPTVTLWGREGVMIYNDGYALICGARHPACVGAKVREAWPEAVEFNDRMLRTCLEGGTLGYRDQEFVLYRNGAPETVWLDLDYSPILDTGGRAVGVMAVVIDKTEKVVAERWKASERDRQRQMFEQSPGFMAMLTGPDHVFDLTNQAYTQLVGHRDVLGKPVREALPDIEGQGFFELLDEVYRTGEAFVGKAMRVHIQRTPGAPLEERIVDLVYQPIRDPAGRVMGIFAQGADVTSHVEAEAALRHSEMRFREFADLVPNHMWTTEPDGRLEWINPRLASYLGTDLDHFGNAVWDAVHPDDFGRVADAWAEAVATGTAFDLELRLRRHDGAWRWQLSRAVPIRDGAGRIERWIGTNTDIDDQKRADQALRESERRLRLSQSAARIGSLELDVASGKVIGSEVFWKLWGLGPRESADISVLENLVIPEDSAVRSTEETRRDGTAVPSVEYRIRRADDGALRWLSRSIDFVHDETGRPVKMFGVIQDITERKAAQARQLVLTHELEHRIKNILAMVSAIASQTLRSGDIDKARVSLTERLRALAQAHDLLNETRWTDASLDEVVRKTIAALPIDQITVEGPSLAINAKMALTMALAVNELGTNALKYGALSTSAGNVLIRWTLEEMEEGATLTWSWTERGGPPVRPPSRKGFGSFLIERVLGIDFGGAVRVVHGERGLECVLVAPYSVPVAPFGKAE